MKMKQSAMKKMKKTALAASVTAALAIGGMGQATAAVYGLSALDIDNLSIVVSPAAGSTVTSFNFNLTNTATLNGVPDIGVASCSSAAANCGGAGAPLVLDALEAEVGTPGRTNNLMNYLSPAITSYANSDSVINDAQLVGDAFTDTDNLAEANLADDGGESASASSQIQSTTGFTFTFTIDAPGSLALSFDADPDMRALIDAFEDGGSAQADLNASFTLQQNSDAAGGSLGFINWNPQGTAANDCTASGGPTCTETADTQDLNINVGTTTLGTSSVHSFGAGDMTFGDTLTAFGISVTGLDAGTWTLTLNEVKSVNLTRDVPEPGILALLSIGLMGLGASGLRRKRT